jgi:hypothetical protein
MMNASTGAASDRGPQRLRKIQLVKTSDGVVHNDS